MHEFWLASIQGITEFFPVSSTAHMIIFCHFLGIPEIEKSQEIFLHLGTLAVVLCVFRKKLSWMFFSCFSSLRKRALEKGARRALFLVVSTLPCIFFGFLLECIASDIGRSLYILGISSCVAGAVLLIADYYRPASKTLDDLTNKDSFIVGLFQAFALIPGVSRLGASLTGFRFLGYKTPDACEFSFLLSIPNVLGAVVLTWIKAPYLLTSNENCITLLGITMAFGFPSILLFMRRPCLKTIAVYRIVLGLYLMRLLS